MPLDTVQRILASRCAHPRAVYIPLSIGLLLTLSSTGPDTLSYTRDAAQTWASTLVCLFILFSSQ
jgi:hypothetical protein